jgi:hypothetical protein
MIYNVEKFKHGQNFSAKIKGIPCRGKVAIDRFGIFLCQNDVRGSDAVDKLGYEFSWHIWVNTSPPFWANDLFLVEDLVLEPVESKNKSLNEILSL